MFIIEYFQTSNRVEIFLPIPVSGSFPTRIRTFSDSFVTVKSSTVLIYSKVMAQLMAQLPVQSTLIIYRNE